MQNGTDIVKDQAETTLQPPSTSVHVTEAEISVEAIKLSKHPTTGAESSSSAIGGTNQDQLVDASQALGLLQKGSKNETTTSPDTSVPEKPDDLQVVGEKNGDEQGETPVAEVKDSSAMEEELLVSEDEPNDESLVDNIGSDDTVMIEPYMQALAKNNGSNGIPIKRKRGRPKKSSPEGKGKKKSGRPRKNSEPTPKPPETAPSGETGDPSNPAPNPNVEVDLFTYVPGKTSEPIQLSAVSSVVSGSDGSAASVDGEVHGSEVAAGESEQKDGGNTEVKKLLKSKLLKNSSPGSEKSRKRKASSVKDSQGKVRKVASRPPAEDSSSLQKKQDLFDFLDATTKVMSGQEADGQMEIQGGAAVRHQSDDAIASALMAQGPCLDLDEDDLQNPQPTSQFTESNSKKIKRKYVRKNPKKNSPKSPEDLKSLAEIATVSRSFEALHTSDAKDDGNQSWEMTPELPVIGKAGKYASKVTSSKVGRPRKYKKKNNLTALQAKFAKNPSHHGAVLDIHNGEMTASSQEGIVNSGTIDQKADEALDIVHEEKGNPSPQIINQPGLENQSAKKISKIGSSRQKYKRRKFHNWNKKKRHTPAVLQRLANQVQAFQAAQELARIEAAYQELNPGSNLYPEKPVLSEYLPVAPRVKRKYVRKGYPKVKKVQKKTGDPLVLESVAGGQSQIAGVESHVAGCGISSKMQIASRGRKKGYGGKVAKKSSPIVRLSPIAKKKVDLNMRDGVDPFNNAIQSESQNVLDEPPILTKISSMEANQLIPNSSQSMLSPQYNADLNSPYGDQHSDLSNSSSKRSYLKPKQATEFEKDTGAVSLKNILPGRRKLELKKKTGANGKHGTYSKVAHGRVDKKGIGRGFIKGYKRGLMFSRSDPGQDVGRTETKQGVMDYSDFVSSDQFGSPRQTSTRTPSPVFSQVHPHRNVYEKSSNHPTQSRHRDSRGTGDRLQSSDVFSPEDINQSPSSHQHRPRERHHGRQPHNIHRQSSSGHKHSFSEDNDPPSSSERNSNRSYTESPKGKGVIGSTVGAVISQLFGDEIPRLAPGSGYVINVRLDVERKEATGTRKSHKSVSTQEDLDGSERRRHSSHHSTSKEKSTHVSSTVNSYTRKSQSSEPQPSTSTAPDEPQPRETSTPRPRISDVDLCAMLEERISSRHGLRVDVRDNLLDNIKHVERVLKESS